jgi:hypothetical protein
MDMQVAIRVLKGIHHLIRTPEPYTLIKKGGGVNRSAGRHQMLFKGVDTINRTCHCFTVETLYKKAESSSYCVIRCDCK